MTAPAGCSVPRESASTPKATYTSWTALGVWCRSSTKRASFCITSEQQGSRPGRVSASGRTANRLDRPRLCRRFLQPPGTGVSLSGFAQAGGGQITVRSLHLFGWVLVLSSSLAFSQQPPADTLGMHNLTPGSGASIYVPTGNLGCTYCHAPHSGLGGVTPLWNQQLSKSTLHPLQQHDLSSDRQHPASAGRHQQPLPELPRWHCRRWPDRSLRQSHHRRQLDPRRHLRPGPDQLSSLQSRHSHQRHRRLAGFVGLGRQDR